MPDQFTLDTLYETYREFYQGYKIELDNLKEVHSEQGGSINDFAWSIFQKILLALAKSFQNSEITEEYYYSKTKSVYWEMTLFQRRYENKKGNHTHNQYLISDLKLEKAKFPDYVLKAVVICSPRSCCEYCNSQDGKTMPLEEAILNPPFDSNKCTHEYGCRCCYGYSVD